MSIMLDVISLQRLAKYTYLLESQLMGVKALANSGSISSDSSL